MLHPHVRKVLISAVVQPHLHAQVIPHRNDFRAEGDAVGQGTVHCQRSVRMARPFKRFQGDPPAVPYRIDMGVSQVGEPEIGPDGFQDVEDGVSVSIPWSKHTDLGFPLRVDGSFQESYARMPSARVREDKQGGVRRTSSFLFLVKLPKNCMFLYFLVA